LLMHRMDDLYSV